MIRNRIALLYYYKSYALTKGKINNNFLSLKNEC